MRVRFVTSLRPPDVERSQSVSQSGGTHTFVVNRSCGCDVARARYASVSCGGFRTRFVDEHQSSACVDHLCESLGPWTGASGRV